MTITPRKYWPRLYHLSSLALFLYLFILTLLLFFFQNYNQQFSLADIEGKMMFNNRYLLLF